MRNQITDDRDHVAGLVNVTQSERMNCTQNRDADPQVAWDGTEAHARRRTDMRVLIAGGGEEFLEILQAYLWDQGHEAEVAVDGLECVIILREFSPDIVLLEHDLLWGGSDGVLAVMRDNPVFSETPVIVMTNHDPRESPESPLNSSVVGYLRKPFRLRDLLERINSAECVIQPPKCRPKAK